MLIKSTVIIRNHPSKDPTSSEEDTLLTRQLYICSTILG
ncbi:MAG: hypothetical protein HXS46_18480 [Theionarchaea archaeon]|nr:hypothetical protein [Theionarchaea archaeon]